MKIQMRTVNQSICLNVAFEQFIRKCNIKILIQVSINSYIKKGLFSLSFYG